MKSRDGNWGLSHFIAALSTPAIPLTRSVARHRTTANRPSTRTPYSKRRSWKRYTCGLLPRGGQK